MEFSHLGMDEKPQSLCDLEVWSPAPDTLGEDFLWGKSSLTHNLAYNYETTETTEDYSLTEYPWENLMVDKSSSAPIQESIPAEHVELLEFFANSCGRIIFFN